MPDGILILHSKFPCKVMLNPRYHRELDIDELIEDQNTKAFCLNEYKIKSYNCCAEDSGCGGNFCDKQRVLEVRSKKQGCCCYSYDNRRSNVVMDHGLIVRHESLNEALHFKNFSSLNFSLLYQTSVFNSHVIADAIGLNDVHFNIEDAVEACVELINENGGFTVIGWYKRSVIMDQTIKHQESNKDNKFNNSDNIDKVSSGNIVYYPCVIKPTNTDFLDSGTELYRMLKELKFDPSTIMG